MARRNPLLVGTVAAIALAAPLLCWLAGGRMAGPLAMAVRWDPSGLLLLGAVVAALVGTSLATGAPELHKLDDQLRTTDAGPGRLGLGYVVLPSVAALGAVGFLAACFLTPVLSEVADSRVPVRLSAALALGIIVVGASAVLVEAARSAVRGRFGQAAGAALLPALCALGLGGTAIPMRLSRAVTGRGAVPAGLLALTLLAGATLLVTWCILALNRPPERQRGARALVALPSGGGATAGTAMAVAAQVLRRRSVRSHVVTVMVVAAGYAAAARWMLDVAWADSAPVSGLLVISGLVVPGLAAAAQAAEVGWLWSTTPLTARRFAGGVALGGTGVVVAPTALVLVPLLAAANAPWQVWRDLALLALLSAPAAVVAGTIIPWRDDRVSGQFGAYLSYMGLAGLGYWAAGRLAQLFPVPGAGPVLAVSVVATALIGVALWRLSRMVELSGRAVQLGPPPLKGAVA